MLHGVHRDARAGRNRENDGLMNKWWGEPWPSAELRAPVCEDESLHVAIPAGKPCMYCDELISSSDQGTTFPGFINADGLLDQTPLHAHRECMLRNVMGCSAHLRGEPHDHEVPYREDARRVERWLEDQR